MPSTRLFSSLFWLAKTYSPVSLLETVESVQSCQTNSTRKADANTCGSFLQAAWWWAHLWSFWQPASSGIENTTIWQASSYAKYSQGCVGGGWVPTPLDRTWAGLQAAHWKLFEFLPGACWSCRRCCKQSFSHTYTMLKLFWYCCWNQRGEYPCRVPQSIWQLRLSDLTSLLSLKVVLWILRGSKIYCPITNYVEFLASYESGALHLEGPGSQVCHWNSSEFL